MSKGLEQAKPKKARGETTYSAACVPERPQSYSLTSPKDLLGGMQVLVGLTGLPALLKLVGKPQLSPDVVHEGDSGAWKSLDVVLC